MKPCEIKLAVSRAKKSVACAIRAGEKPDSSDLLLLQHLSAPRTFCDRLRSSALPLMIVAVAMLILALLATSRPPIAKVTGEARTAALDIMLDAGLPENTALDLAGGNAMQFRASGFASAQIGSCMLDLSDDDLPFTGKRVRLPLAGASRLRMEVDRDEASFGGSSPSLSLYIASETSTVVDAFGASSKNVQRLNEACSKSSNLTLDPGPAGPAGPARVEIAAPKVPAVEFPDYLSALLRFPVATMEFGHWQRSGHAEFCALKSAQFTVQQEIAPLSLSARKLVTPPPGTCFEIIDGDVNVIPLSDGSFSVRFTSTGVNVDDGLTPNATGLTYLEVLTSDPDITLIAGAITFILTTVWSFAVLLKEILT